MKKYNILIFALLFASLLKAQFAPVGAKWYYGIESNDPPGQVGYTMYEAITDTIIQNDTFVKIYNYPDISYYLQQRGGKTNYWMNNKKCLLFDADIKKGDTITIDAYFKYKGKDTAIPVKIFLDTIFSLKNNIYDKNDTVTIYRVKHVGLILNGYFGYGYYTKKFIKSVYFDNYFISIFNFPTTGDLSIYFRCFNSANYNYKDSTLASKPCDYNNVGIKDLSNQISIAIYPNPTKDKLGISFGNHVNSINLNIYNFAGQLVKQSNINSSKDIQIDISDLGVGLYFIKFISEETKYTSKFIKE